RIVFWRTLPTPGGAARVAGARRCRSGPRLQHGTHAGVGPGVQQIGTRRARPMARPDGYCHLAVVLQRIVGGGKQTAPVDVAANHSLRPLATTAPATRSGGGIALARVG